MAQVASCPKGKMRSRTGLSCVSQIGRDCAFLSVWLVLGALLACMVVLSLADSSSKDTRPDTVVHARGYSALPCLTSASRVPLRIAIVGLIKVRISRR
jgi:hypothetical protein